MARIKNISISSNIIYTSFIFNILHILYIIIRTNGLWANLYKGEKVHVRGRTGIRANGPGTVKHDQAPRIYLILFWQWQRPLTQQKTTKSYEYWMFCLSNVQSLLFIMIIYELLLLVNNKVLNFQLFYALCLYLVWLTEIECG